MTFLAQLALFAVASTACAAVLPHAGIGWSETHCPRPARGPARSRWTRKGWPFGAANGSRSPAATRVPLNSNVFMWLGGAAVISAFVVGPYALRPCPDASCNAKDMIRAQVDRRVVLAADGSTLADGSGTSYVPLDEMPAFVPDLVVAIEDKRYWIFPCVDPLSVARAAWVTASTFGARKQGASGICWQLPRGLDPARTLRPDHNWGGKIAEATMGLRIYAALGFNKTKMLELYLNTVDLGVTRHGEPIRGFEAASWEYYGVPLSQLSLGQAAALTGMIQAPGRLDPRDDSTQTLARRATVLRLLTEYNNSYAVNAAAAQVEPLAIAQMGSLRPGSRLALQVVSAIDDTVSGPIRTTINLPMQLAFEGMIADRIAVIEEGQFGTYTRSDLPDEQLTGFAIAIDAPTGVITAYACGRNDNARIAAWDGCRNGAIALASTMKVFLLAAAVQHGRIRLDEKVRDVERRVGHAAFRSDFAAKLRTQSRRDRSVLDAFARSDNYLALLMLASLPHSATAWLNGLGIEADIKKPATALGTAYVNPLVLAAYMAALATNGSVPTPHFVAGWPVVQPPVQSLALSPATLAAVRQAMSAVVTHPAGTARSGRGALPNLHAKTGTNGESDVRIVGFTRNGTASVFWIGHSTSRKMVAGTDAGTMLARPWADALGNQSR